MSFLRKNTFLRAWHMHKMSTWITSGESAHQTCQNQPMLQCWLLYGTGLWSHFSLKVHGHFQHSVLVYLGWIWTKVWAPKHSKYHITRVGNAEELGLVFKVLQKDCRPAPEQPTLHPIHPEACSPSVSHSECASHPELKFALDDSTQLLHKTLRCCSPHCCKSALG